MSKLSEFIGAPKVVEIKGKKIELHPLKMGDLQLFAKENLTEEEQLKVAIELIQKSLNDPEVTAEEVKSMSMESFIFLMDEINKLNGFEDERIAKIKERIVQTRRK